MYTGESYLQEINRIDNELKRLNKRSKALREQKAKTMTNLHGFMKSRGLEKIGEGKNAITIEKCAPKMKKKSKPKKEKVKDAIELFKAVGIPDPQGFYDKFEQTQKSK